MAQTFDGVHASTDPDKPFRILAIDGGGIRGIIPARALIEIERLAGRPVYQLFDLIAGTSTGGVLALGLTMPDGTGNPAWSARDLFELYEREGQGIFAHHPGRRVVSLWGLRRSIYSASGIESVLTRYFGETRLSEALTDVMVPAYDIEERCRYWFKSRKARGDPDDDVQMAHAARATSAAPVYFPPAQVQRALRARALVDGGLFANNPAAAAYADARDPTAYNASDILLVSLGTGALTRPLPYREVRQWGLARWAIPILDLVFDGIADETENSIRKLLGQANYLRLQLRLDQASDNMDDATPENVHRLKAQADTMVHDRHADLEQFVHRLDRDANS